MIELKEIRSPDEQNFRKQSLKDSLLNDLLIEEVDLEPIGPTLQYSFSLMIKSAFSNIFTYSD